MLNKDEIMQRLNQMDPHDVTIMVKEAMDESGIEYSHGPGEIIFDGLLSDNPKLMDNNANL